MSQTPRTRRTATDAISMADRIEWTPRRGNCTSAAARSAPCSGPEATLVAPRRHGASTHVSRVDGRRADGSPRPLERRTGSKPSGANGSRCRPTMPPRGRRAPIAATPTAQRARSRGVARRWDRSQRDSGAGRRGTPPRRAPTADGDDLAGHASRPSLAPAPNAAAPVDADTNHGACSEGGHLGRNARGPERGTRRMQRPQRPWARMRTSGADGGRPNGSACTVASCYHGFTQCRGPLTGEVASPRPLRGSPRKKPNEVIRRPYPSSASKTGLGCGRDDDARSSYEAPGMIGQATTSSETPSITSVAG